MALNFGIEPPQWLQNQDTWIKGISDRGERNFINMASFAMQSQNNKLAQAAQILDMQQKENAISLGQTKIAALNKDYSEIPNWLQQHPTWESRQDTSWPSALTPEGDKMLNDVRLRDSQSIQAKAMVESTHDFASRVDALRKVDPAVAGQFAPYISGKITPTILQALSVAEEASKVHQENEKKIAEIEALQRGDAATTKITSKGVETTFKPSATANSIPQTKDIGGGVTLAWVPGGKTLHVIKADGTKTELTPSQLQNIAKGMESNGDPRAKNILEFLAGKAMDTVEKSAAPPGPATPVKTYNPQTGKIE